MHNQLFQGSSSNDASWPTSAGFAMLEKKLEDPSTAPVSLPLDFLKYVTRNFSKDLELGRGGFGVVYKGVLQNGKTIAVKKLCNVHLDDGQFHNEVTDFIGLKHKNIVQLIGYCAESRSEAIEISKGKYVMAEKQDKLICFEYIKNKSLDRYISAESSGLEWHTRFEIIKGICCGLHYLHKERHTVHLDLKPQNILMDDNMVPKIADFGMSRLFGEQQSRIITHSRGGTFGYMAPEYLNNGLITTKADIFSLGVIIIEILIGSRDYPRSTEACFEHFADNVVKKWRKKLEATLNNHIRLEIYSKQVNTCITIGRRCVDSDPKKRPAAWDIIKTLSETESELENRWPGVNGGPLVDEAGRSGIAKVLQQLLSSEAECIGFGGLDINGRFSYGGACSPGRSASMQEFCDTRIDNVDGEIVGMFGVFDGHGSGVAAAEYVKQHLFSNLINHPKLLTDTKTAIAETYSHTDSEFLKSDSSQTQDAGSTALTAIIVGDRLLVANLGDSRGVIITERGEVIAVSRNHTPDQPDEKGRIENAGGILTWNTNSRHFVMLVDGVEIVSRAFGYKSFKQKQYLIADPEIKELVVGSPPEFLLILATDGLWEAVSQKDAVIIASSIQDPEEAAERLVQEAFKRGSTDNITVIIVRTLGETTWWD